MNTLNMTVEQLAALPTAVDGTLKQGIGTTKLAESLGNGSIVALERPNGYALTLPEGTTTISNAQSMAYMLLQYTSNKLDGADLISFGENETISFLQSQAKGAKPATNLPAMTSESRRLVEITKHFEKSSYATVLPVIEQLLSLTFLSKNADKWQVIQDLQQLFYPDAVRDIVTEMAEREQAERERFAAFENLGLSVVTHTKTGSFEITYPVTLHPQIMELTKQYVLLDKPKFVDDTMTMLRLPFRDLIPADQDII
jgi:hypothetical protein